MGLFIGLLACVVSSVFFGSMFVALKRCNAGDGIFAQWVTSMAILCVGYVVFWYQNFPGFYPLAMLGGLFWTNTSVFEVDSFADESIIHLMISNQIEFVTFGIPLRVLAPIPPNVANSTAVPLINRIGLSTGILIWGSAKCLTGWVTGRFGVFGMKPNPPASDLLNYTGLTLVILGGFMFSLVNAKPNRTLALRLIQNEEEHISTEDTENESYVSNSSSCETSTAEEFSVRIGGRERAMYSSKISMGGDASIFKVLFVQMSDHSYRYPNYPKDGLAYVLSHFFGIFVSATIIFIVYGIARKNQPYASPELVLPGFLAGLLWGVGQSAFFVANQHLSQAISFPIITGLPGCVASAWGIFYFREITASPHESGVIWISAG
ncbi:hypothetical protein RB195_014089 [Necator americanus]|uniref:Uncharacterized protein n=1 Tax=Necator americanus TaxID=51031 RepID=A0ABR1DYY5_NECAM